MKNPLFSKSLTMLKRAKEAPQESATPQQQAETEMMSLAKGVLPGFVDDSLLSVTCSARNGYQVQFPSADIANIKEACRALAVASGYPVSCRIADGDVEQFPSARVPVRLPGVLPQLSIRRCLVADIVEKIAAGGEGGESSPVEVNGVKREGDPVTERHPSTSVSPDNLGTTLKGSLAVLGEERFYQDLLAGKARSGRDLVISCEFDDVKALIDEKLSPRFPLRYSKNGQQAVLLCVDVRCAGDQEEIKQGLRAIEALTAWKFELKFEDLVVDFMVPPDTAWGEPTLRVATDGRPLLPMFLCKPLPDSNIVPVHLTFPLHSSRVLDLVRAQIETGCKHVSLIEKIGSPTYGEQEFRQLILRVSEELDFGDLNVAAGPDGVTVSLDCSPDLVDCQRIPLIVDLIEALSFLCRKQVVVKRQFVDEDISQFCSQEFGDDFEWAIERNESGVIFTTVAPDRVKAEQAELFSKVFGLQFMLACDPENSGTAEPRLVGVGARELALRHELSALLPPAIGRFARFSVNGDRLIIFAQTKNLPKAYVDSAVQDLTSIRCNTIEVREDPQARKVVDPALLSDIIVRTLRKDAYLREIQCTEKGIVVILSKLSKAASISDEYRAELQACCGLPLQFDFSQFPYHLKKRLLDGSTDERSRRILAQVVTDGDRLVGQARFWHVIKDVFGLEQPPLKGIVPTRSKVLAEVRDLTHLRCFSVDKEFARFKEDVFSVEPDAESGGWTLGVHISNAARYVEEGSTLDVLARRFGEFQRLHDGNERHHVFMLPKVIRDAIDLSVNQPRETFSLMFSIDDDLKIRDGSQWLGLALVKSRASYSHGQLERNLDSDDPFPEFKLLEQFSHNYPNIFWAQGPIGKFMPAAAIVGGMVDIFNSHVVNILKAKQIALPRHHNDRSAKLRHRLTGGGRTYTSLEAQRQLLAYLEKREAHSKAEVAAIVETIGVAPSESAAYKLFSCALAKWEMHREVKLRLCPDGVVEG